MAVGNSVQKQKIVALVQPQAIKDDALFVGSVGSTPAYCDCSGWNSARVVFQIGSIDATIAKMNVYECDTSGGTYTEIAGADFVADTTSEPGASDDNKIYSVYLDMRKQMRYLEVELQAGDGAAGTYATAFVILSDPDIAPNSASERGDAASIFI